MWRQNGQGYKNTLITGLCNYYYFLIKRLPCSTGKVMKSRSQAGYYSSSSCDLPVPIGNKIGAFRQLFQQCIA